MIEWRNFGCGLRLVFFFFTEDKVSHEGKFGSKHSDLCELTDAQSTFNSSDVHDSFRATVRGKVILLCQTQAFFFLMLYSAVKLCTFSYIY